MLKSAEVIKNEWGGGIGGVQFPEFPENFPGIDLIPGFPGKKCLIPGIPGPAIIFGNKLIVNTEETCQRHLHIYALIVTLMDHSKCVFVESVCNRLAVSSI